MLEPEPCDVVAVLRPVVSSQSGRDSSEEDQSTLRGGGGFDVHDGADHDETDRERRHTETSPLLPPRDNSVSPEPTLNKSHVNGHDNDTTNDSDEGPPPPYLNGVSPGRFWFIFSQLLLSQFIGCFDGTIMASSHPVITSYFGAANSASWLSTAFLLTSTAFQPLLGRLSDAVGRKPLFLVGLAIFFASSLGAGAAQSMEQLVLMRGIQGIGGGVIMTTSFAVIADLYSPLERGKVTGLVSGTFGLASVIGPVAGGALTEAISWRWIFYVNLPIIAVAFLVILVVVPFMRTCSATCMLSVAQEHQAYVAYHLRSE